MNTYRIPAEGRTPQEYGDYINSLPWAWGSGDRVLQIDAPNETVTASATITGFELLPAASNLQIARMLDKDTFIERFTPAEYAGIRALRATNVTVDWLMAVLEAKSGQVNLSSPRLAGGLAYIESLPGSPLAAGRAAQIMGA